MDFRRQRLRLVYKVVRQCALYHSKTHVVTVLWLDSDIVVTISSHLLETQSKATKPRICATLIPTVTVTVCNGYLVSSHVVTVQLPTRCLVDRFLHRSHSSGYLITCVSDVVTVQLSQCWGLENSESHSGSHCVVTLLSMPLFLSMDCLAPSDRYWFYVSRWIWDQTFVGRERAQ